MMETVLPVTVYIGVEAVIGFFGNIMILLVYSLHYEKSNFRIFVLFMAMVDLTSCMTILPLEMFSQMNWYTYQHGWMCSIKTFINVYTAWASASILLLLAYDRNRKICRPLRQQILPSKAMKLCIGSLVLSLSIAAPVLPLWGEQTYVLDVNGMNLTVSVCEKSNQFKDTIYPFAYILSVYVIPMAFMVLVLMVLNVWSVLVLFGRSQNLARMKSIKVTKSSASKTSLSSISLETETTTVNNEFPTTVFVNVCNVCGFKHVHEECSVIKARAKNLKRLDDSSGDNSLQKYGKKKKSNSTDNKPCFTISGSIENRLKDTNALKTRENNKKRMFRVGSEESMNVNSTSKPKSGRTGSTGSNGNSNLSSSFSYTSNEARKLEVMKRKTRIMLVLTSVFAITMTTYVILTFLVSLTDGILKNLTNSGKVTFFFFWRLYFMNTIINPILYGFMDPRFRSGLAMLTKRLWMPCVFSHFNFAGFQTRTGQT